MPLLYLFCISYFGLRKWYSASTPLMTDWILNFSTGICNSSKKLLEANTIMPKSCVSLRKVCVFENLGLLEVICWSSKNATNSAWNWFRLYWGLDPNPWLAFGLGVEVGTDYEVSDIWEVASKRQWGFSERSLSEWRSPSRITTEEN